MSIDELRHHAMDRGLTRTDLDADPFRQFEHWFKDAIDTGVFEPNAMSLATVDEHGQPSLRTVLLKLFDEQGFVFFTNYASRKAGDIEGNSKVALLFPWVTLGRQVKITGSAARIPLAESMGYFATRPRGSQIGAWASPQSRVISSRSLLEAKVDEIKRKFTAGEIPLPSFWGGYRVSPRTIEFWQARESRLHDRFEYRRDESGRWFVQRLAP
ncbi:MAG: pyridoxamine 5'-phosphate oxidase [Gammaproteobacteria bacterium]